MDFGKFWEKYGLYVAFLLMFVMMWTYTVPWLRTDVGMGMDSIFAPLVTTFNIPFFILIVILSAFTGLYSSIIQKYTIDYDRMIEVQDRMRDFQKEYREAMLSKDEKRIKKLDAKKDRMMREQLDLSQQQFKPMGYILVLTVPIFFWLLYRLNEIHTTITFPYYGVLNLTSTVIWVIPAWMIWYMICSITISQVIRKALNIGGI